MVNRIADEPSRLFNDAMAFTAETIDQYSSREIRAAIDMIGGDEHEAPAEVLLRIAGESNDAAIELLNVAAMATLTTVLELRRRTA